MSLFEILSTLLIGPLMLEKEQFCPLSYTAYCLQLVATTSLHAVRMVRCSVRALRPALVTDRF